MTVRIERVLGATDEIVDSVARLVKQLSSSAEPVTWELMEQIISSDACAFVIARNSFDQIVGCATLVVFPIPTGIRAWVEDVVVDEAERGKGIGEALTKGLIGIAQSRGAKTVDLTSRPSREAANRMYKRVGFTERETNVYRYELD